MQAPRADHILSPENAKILLDEEEKAYRKEEKRDNKVYLN